MPPSGSSRKDNNAQLKALDKESKRAKGALSCAECRRLKLKCDKTVPCASCKRRGCSAICPNGSLITGQGTRFVLADTEKLHKKIAQMSDRIRQLEGALSILQSTLSSEPHPLLTRELLKIKSSIELHAAVDDDMLKAQASGRGVEDEGESVIDAFGTLAIRDDGAATFYGRSAGSEVSLLLSTSTISSSPRSAIAALNASFPLSTNAFQNSTTSLIDMDYLLVNFLPKWEEAWRLSQLYLEQAPWFFGAVTKRQLVEEMLPMWYFEARGLAPPSVSGSYSTSSSSSSTATQAGPLPTPLNPNAPTTSQQQQKQQTRTAHDLALLFMIFCFGALTDINLPAAPENTVSEEFFQLTKAALVLEPVLERAPSVATVQTLSLIAIYEGICSRDGSIERTWGAFGVAVKLAQSIGLHRDCARWKLSPAEVQKRRALFWELFITDCWLSLATGRLATFSLPFVDCELPIDPDSTIAEDGSIQPSFPFWKAHFGAECVSAVVQGTLTSRAPKYSIILDLDRKVRDMGLPLYTQQAERNPAFDFDSSNLDRAGEGVGAAGLGLGETMSRLMPINYRELTLLYIHRCFFAHAIETHPADPIKSQYAPSFLAGYRSACTILGSVRKQFMLFPRQIARFWVLWTHAFSATVMLSSVATHVSKQSQVAHAAMIELDNACDLFEHAARHGGRAVKFLPVLQRLRRKARKSFEDSERGLPPTIHNDVLKPSKTDEEKNEMEIFGGKTHTVATKSPAATTNGLKRVASSGSLVSSSSRGSSGSPKIKPMTTTQTYLQVPGQAPGLPPNTQGIPPDSNAYGGAQSQQPQAAVPMVHQQQQQLMSQYPSFEGVHPSLVHELNGFGGRIEAQVKQAYEDGIDGNGGRQACAGGGPYESHGMVRDEGGDNSGQEPSPPPPPPPAQARNRQSSSSLRQVYTHGQDTMYRQGQGTPPTQYQHHPQQQQPLHVIPPQHYANARDTLVTPSSGGQTPVTPYDVQAPYNHQAPYPPQQISQQSQHPGYHAENYSHYWAAAPSSVREQAYAQQQPQIQYNGQSASYQGGQVHIQQQQQGQQQQQYTPTGVLRGIAADDTRLQETWQTYMYNLYQTNDQKNWVNKAPLVEFAINSSISVSTKFAPFELNYGYLLLMI
ncbi:hypothetical protein AN958_05229 [Leucoagaricus sp. SymC.cos]|nr:hypothetical protein AN958_05229 [Leucoagaricus sp. SymC.cos]